MTLAELAALAAKVEGFVQPRVCCSLCRGTSLAWGTEPCFQCGCTGWTDDNSPAALLMAVAVVVAKGTDVMLLGRRRFSIARDVGPGPVYSDDLPMAEPESIARAALVALLRAHGVEVPE